ncbi:hypothetical protein [Thermus scotoductus]|uniref:Uncharacterized protein n=1 Tax=Thermus scotoductus TaxID=37636 RepID=A0A430R1J7_THESC|nr:hypothetical protein [Thermus scotoductus]RTG93386.1 hypothetical protein CSW49_10860 [Thermus scotoductus]RTH01271.1 hypothetical protein CSW45_10745 [Thermus scotoductus]RTH17157.1 hypothetical protein CSW42_11020 [Thermus scotoductus]RTH97403.1 hypothetical protein CSW28_10885 [Thermus scotoductus]RTI18650.1 hypothetical protein CSW21_10585 [Thermus scotoductus]
MGEATAVAAVVENYLKDKAMGPWGEALLERVLLNLERGLLPRAWAGIHALRDKGFLSEEEFEALKGLLLERRKTYR